MGRSLQERVEGVLLGTALGDALGLAMEGMGPATIARRFGRVDRFHILGRTGFVSDDTEQSALMAQALCVRDQGDDAVVTRLRRGILGWFLRLPWGIGLGTLRACMKMALGLRTTGVNTAGNGAAMRAAVLGVVLFDDVERRRQLGAAMARVTHTHPAAVDGALFVAELAAQLSDGVSPHAAALQSLGVVKDAHLRAALEKAMALGVGDVPLADAARITGTSGWVVHTLAWALCVLLRHPDHALDALQDAIAAGGDTDSVAAILGAWLGARLGTEGLPLELVERIHHGPFGPDHLQSLAAAVATGAPAPRYSWLAAMLRNLALYPVVLAHGFRRLWPW